MRKVHRGLLMLSHGLDWLEKSGLSNVIEVVKTQTLRKWLSAKIRNLLKKIPMTPGHSWTKSQHFSREDQLTPKQRHADFHGSKVDISNYDITLIGYQLTL